jgi:hypothetical protein
MTAYIKLSTGEYPRHEGDIRLDHPDMGNEFMCPSTYDKVDYIQSPDFNGTLQYCYEAPPVLVDGVWIMEWVVRNKTTAELAEEERLKVLMIEMEAARLLRNESQNISDAIDATLTTDIVHI